MTPTKEKISFELCFRSIYWDLPPVVEVLIDSVSICKEPAVNKEHCIKFFRELDFGQHQLQISRSNKFDDQCKISDDGIMQDQYIVLEKIKIDGIDIQNLIWYRSWYEPDYPKEWAAQQKAKGIDLESKAIGETWWSHNGIWRFDFFSPFYKFVISQFQ